MAFDSINSIRSVGSHTTVSYDTSKVVDVNDSVTAADVTQAGSEGVQCGEGMKDSQSEHQQASSKSVEDAVKRANNMMNKTHCEFSYNNEVNRVSITVYDDVTGEVVREIPPEESLKMLEKLWELTGLMVDEKR